MKMKRSSFFNYQIIYALNEIKGGDESISQRGVATCNKLQFKFAERNMARKNVRNSHTVSRSISIKKRKRGASPDIHYTPLIKA